MMVTVLDDCIEAVFGGTYLLGAFSSLNQTRQRDVVEHHFRRESQPNSEMPRLEKRGQDIGSGTLLHASPIHMQTPETPELSPSLRGTGS